MTDVRQELASLRLRAYGPDADIAGDQVALARLAALEHALRPAEVPDVFPERTVVAPTPVADASPISDASPIPNDAPEVVQTHPPWWLRRHRGWVLGVATMVVLAVIASWGVVTATADRPDASLAPIARNADDQPQRASGLAEQLNWAHLDVDSIRRFPSYRGVTVWSGRTTAGNVCLVATETATDQYVGLSCLPPGLDPTVDLIPDLTIASDMFDLESGDVLRFVLSDGAVHVWLRESNEVA